jgi:tetratricopeptide (TPR) repeat protein
LGDARAVAKAFRLWHFISMKLFFIIVLLLAGLLFPARAQQEADDKYIGIYGLIQQADGLVTTGDAGEALAAYNDAQNQLLQMQKQFPDWNPNIVTFRLNQITDKIAELKNRQSILAAAIKQNEKAAPSATNNPPPTAGAPSSAELDNLRAQLQSAQSANEALQAKLKEALAVQPAAVDPRELQQAQEKIRWLMKQNDLLMVSRGGSIPAKVTTQYLTNTITVFVTNAPVEVTNLAAVFAKNTSPVVVTNYVSVLVPDTNALEMARLDYAAAVKNFNDEHDRAEQLTAQLKKLQQQAAPAISMASTNTVTSLVTNTVAITVTNMVINYVTNSVPGSEAELAALREENIRIKNELATLRAAPPVATDNDQLVTELKQARALVASLQTVAQITALEKMALQNKLQQVLAATNAGVNVADYELRIRELTQERDNLIEKLDQAGKQKSAAKNPATGQIAELNDEVGVLRSRLAVAEAQPVPYSDDEMALFKAAVPPPVSPAAAKKSITEMPAGTAELVASAQQHFVAQEYDAAEADYLKILGHDQNNGIALANLATIELQEGKLDEAEKHITAALAQSPNDAFNLSTFGYLKFRQEKYDEALNALSRAAQIDPNNPEIQNYLGVTLSHKGQRKAAETALRRAIQLNPDYAPAHNNLAVIYLSQTPPLAELARWHYQKALAAGQPRNPDLEKMLADKGAPVAQ